MTSTARPAAGLPRLRRVRDRLVDAVATGHHRSLRLADQLDARGARPGALANAWAAVKLGAVALAAPVGAPVMALVAARSTAQVDEAIERYPDLLDDLLAGRPVAERAARVQRIDAGARWVITSDLHRGPDGTTDLPTLQGSAELYAAMLDAYADQDVGLVEAGDVEDFWLVGGSAYGVAYDLWRMIAGALSLVAGRRALDRVYHEHLQRIAARHRPIYDRIQLHFHAPGRYRRLAGNHDDVYNHPEPVWSLNLVHPGIEVADFLVLDGPHGPVGVITHGHHTDSWNGPWRDGLGKLSTSLASMLYDLPLLRLRPGIATPQDTAALLEGGSEDRLMTLHPTFGANRDLYSVDEVRLHDACRAGWGTDDDGQVAGPLLVLGHTHVPLTDPVRPDGTGSWRRYWNSGSGVFHGLITAVEWDGTADPHEPQLTLVAWRWDPDEPSRAQRLVLERSDDERTLHVRDEATA